MHASNPALVLITSTSTLHHARHCFSTPPTLNRLKDPERAHPDWDKNAAKKKSAVLRAQEEAEAAALKQAEAQKKASHERCMCVSCGEDAWRGAGSTPGAGPQGRDQYGLFSPVLGSRT